MLKAERAGKDRFTGRGMHADRDFQLAKRVGDDRMHSSEPRLAGLPGSPSRKPEAIGHLVVMYESGSSGRAANIGELFQFHIFEAYVLRLEVAKAQRHL